MRMLLQVEGKKAEQVKEFRKIEVALKELDCSGPHSYASLTRQDGSYVQVAGGKDTCLIERRFVEDKKIYRASFSTPMPTSTGVQILECGAGKIQVRENEVFVIDDVISVWRLFFEGEPFHTEIQWEDMTERLQGH